MSFLMDMSMDLSTYAYFQQEFKEKRRRTLKTCTHVLFIFCKSKNQDYTSIDVVFEIQEIDQGSSCFSKSKKSGARIYNVYTCIFEIRNEEFGKKSKTRVFVAMSLALICSKKQKQKEDVHLVLYRT